MAINFLNPFGTKEVDEVNNAFEEEWSSPNPKFLYADKALLNKGKVKESFLNGFVYGWKHYNGALSSDHKKYELWHRTRILAEIAIAAPVMESKDEDTKSVETQNDLYSYGLGIAVLQRFPGIENKMFKESKLFVEWFLALRLTPILKEYVAMKLRKNFDSMEAWAGKGFPMGYQENYYHGKHWNKPRGDVAQQELLQIREIRMQLGI